MNGTRPRLDLSRLPLARILLLGGGVLYFLVLFLPWRRRCFDFGSLGVHCGTQNGVAQGIGVINLLLVLGLIAMEVLSLGRRGSGDRLWREREAAVAAALVVGTVVKLLVGLKYIHVWAFVGLVLASGIGYGGWLRWREARGSPSTEPLPTTPEGLPQ